MYNNYNNGRKNLKIVSGIVSCLMFAVLALFIFIFNGIMFSGITSCKDKATAVVWSVEEFEDSEGDPSYKYTYCIDYIYYIKSRISTSTPMDTGQRIDVVYNTEKDLVYTTGQVFVYNLVKIAGIVSLVISLINLIIVIVKVVAIAGVAGLIINQQNKQDKLEYQQWQAQQQAMQNNQNYGNQVYTDTQNSIQNTGYQEYGNVNNTGYDSTTSNIQGVNGYNSGMNSNQ